ILAVSPEVLFCRIVGISNKLARAEDPASILASQRVPSVDMAEHRLKFGVRANLIRESPDVVYDLVATRNWLSHMFQSRELEVNLDNLIFCGRRVKSSGGIVSPRTVEGKVRRPLKLRGAP